MDYELYLLLKKFLRFLKISEIYIKYYYKVVKKLIFFYLFLK